MTPGAPRPIAVGRLTLYLKNLLAGDPQLREIAVRGEITGYRPSSTSQLYFAVKDEQATLSCVVWPQHLARIPPLRDGAKVVVFGAIDLYVKGGRYQLNVRSLELDGDGAIHAALAALRGRLQEEGLFALERKRPLPAAPFAVALVSSPAAQGAIDFLHVCARRSPHVRVTLVETAVQGEGAPEAIARALARASRMPVDLVAVVRGGGAAEDLRAFNHEAVVRAIAACAVPVVTGIGHESDTTLADHVADLRAATPTDAADRLPLTRDLRDRVVGGEARLLASVQRAIGARRQRLAGLSRRLAERSPLAELARRRRLLLAATLRLERAQAEASRRRADRLAALRLRLRPGVEAATRRRRAALDVTRARLGGRDPHAILAAGYAIVRSGGRVVRDVAALAPGDAVEARLAYGTLTARVEGVQGHA